MWEEERAFEVDAPTTEEFPLDSLTADELREKYVMHDTEVGVGCRERGRTPGLSDEDLELAVLDLSYRWKYTTDELLIHGGSGSPSSSAPLRTVCFPEQNLPRDYLLTGTAAYMNGRLHAGHAFSFSKSMTISSAAETAVVPTAARLPQANSYFS